MARNQKQKISKILSCLISSPRPATSQGIASALQLEPSTVNRILNGLVNDGFVKKEPTSRTFYPSANSLFPVPLFHPINASAEKIWSQVLQLRNEWSLTAGFVIFYGLDRVLYALATGSDPLTSQYDTILKSPIHASGSGRLLLASLPEKQRLELLGPEPLYAFTSRTTTTHKELLEEIARIEKDGYVACKDDYIEGFSVVSSPVRFRSRIVGCFFISGRSTQLSTKGLGNLGESLAKHSSLFELSNPAMASFENLFVV